MAMLHGIRNPAYLVETNSEEEDFVNDSFSDEIITTSRESGLKTKDSSHKVENVEASVEENDIFVDKMCTLHRAILKGKTKKVYKYLSKKNNLKKINKRDKTGRCALHFVAVSGNVDLLRLLLSIKDIKVELRDKEGKTPFFKASQVHSLSCMKELKQHGALPNTRDFKGHSPLDHAVKFYNPQYMSTIRYLVEDCEIPLYSKNDHGLAPLHVACTHGHTDVIEYLLEQKADINIRDADGNTPLMLAIKHGKETSISRLRYFGA